MASLIYLFKNRAHLKVGTKSHLKAWAKRVVSLPELMKRNRRRNKLVRAGAVIDTTAEIGEVVIQGNKKYLRIGAFSFIGKAELALHDGIKIGNNVCINDGVILLTATHDLADPLWSHVKKAIFIDDYAWIATNAIILPGVHIGKGAVVGAGAVVSKNVLPYQIVAGNPAQPICKTRVENLCYNPCAFLAANRAWLVG